MRLSFDLARLLILSFCICCANTQLAPPELPPEIVLDRLLHLADESASPCQQAVRHLSTKPSSFIADKPQCRQIASYCPDCVFVGQTGNFEFWDAKQAEIVPACRVEPPTVNELSRILGTIIEQSCRFAVKSGGHERTPNASNADGGVTIDLVRLNTIQVAADRQSVTIGAGLLWRDVYQGLEKEQLMVLGGRVADVGVGGLLLGGELISLRQGYSPAADTGQEGFRSSLMLVG